MLEWTADALLEIFTYVAKPLGANVTNTVAEVAKKAPISINLRGITRRRLDGRGKSTFFTQRRG